MPPLAFRVARGERELEQLHALHYRAFVEEIPQHPRNDARRHVDRFHGENVYLVAVDGETIVGSVALRTRRPFSLDAKLPDLDRYLPRDRRFCEVRLLNILPERRGSNVLPGLLTAVTDYADAEQIDAAVISATTRQLRLYGRLGFVPFGPLVGTADASFQPMLLTIEELRRRAQEIVALPPALRGEAVNLTSGPVAIHPDVQAAFHTAPVSHRSAVFESELRTVKSRLCALTAARNVAVLFGTGTLANDVVAGQLRALGGRGVVFSNGEFGERLADHARRAGLDFEHRRFPWGSAIDPGPLDGCSWVWLTACETSTGVLNSVSARGVKIALDCVSAIGAVPLDLSHVWLASGASGKALASYPGLSFVFYGDVLPTGGPRYLDLELYAADGVPFTHSSNLVRALHAALTRVDWPAHYEELARTGAWLRARLPNVLPGNAPHVITLTVRDSARAAAELERAGFLVSWASGYLRERNWIQVCLMGEVPREALPALVRISRAPSPVA
ncbi:MAG TPA: GNAT family N-acetyltransferase [Thermoanaerobaculia bacterium]|nr:GNAT family N-acetyltransferase [Thermoanaerobaculia bacterium]